MALIHREASEDFPEKSARRAALSSDLVDITGVVEGAIVGVIGMAGMGGPGLRWSDGWLGVIGVLGFAGGVRFGYRGYDGSGLTGSTEMLVGSLRGSLGMLGVGARGGESISMSEGSLLPNTRENSPFWLLVMAKVGSYTLRGGTEKTLDLLLPIAYKRDSIMNYLTWAILTRRPTSVKHSISRELKV